MNIDIRQSIMNNFKESTIEDMRESIEHSIKDNDEITLPGLGVFFEILWKNSGGSERDFILETIKKNI